MTDPLTQHRRQWPLRFGLFLGVLIFAAFPQVLLGLETFVVRDYGFFVYPLAHFQQTSFWRGEIPFWDPFNNCGVPFLAQWNTMALYPPSLIYLLFPLGWSLSFFSLLHLWFAGMGMYFLARRWTGGNFAGVFAGVAFAFNGFSLNLLMWPSHMATLSWMPWVILTVDAAWTQGGRKIILAAFAGAMQMLAGGPEIIFLTWVVATLFWLQQMWQQRKINLDDSGRRHMIWRYPLVIVLVIILTAEQLLPFLDLVAHAQRASGFADLRWSMPGSGWANFLVPMAFGNTNTEGIFFQHNQYWTSSYYLGLGTLWLALLAIFAKRRTCHLRPQVWLLVAIAVAGLLLALGDNTPVLPALRKIVPQLGLITYPIKYIFLTVFVASLLSGYAIFYLERLRSRLLPIGAVLSVLLIGIVVWTQSASSPSDDRHAALLNGSSRAIFLVVIGVILLLLGRQSKFSRLLPLALILVAWADVYTHEPTQNPTAPHWIFQTNLSREKLALNPQPDLGGSRAMVSPAAAFRFESIALADPKNNFLAKRLGYCANCNLLDDVPKVDGFFSLTPRENDEVMSLFYTTTNASYPRLEDFMGVSQITADDQVDHWRSRTNFLPLVTAGQRPVFLDDTDALTLLTRPDFDGSQVVYLPTSAASLITVTNQTSVRVEGCTFGQSTVEATVEAEKSSLVVIAQTYYHDWEAEVDGHPTPLLRANVAFQAVQIPAGRHQLHLFYHDRAFEFGAIVSGLGWLGCLLTLIGGGSRPKIFKLLLDNKFHTVSILFPSWRKPKNPNALAFSPPAVTAPDSTPPSVAWARPA